MSNLPAKFTSPLFLALMVIILIGFFIPLSFVTKKFPAPQINFEEVNYPSRVWKDRVINNANTATSERDKSKRFELYSLIFRDLAAIYERDHDSKTRTQTQSLEGFIAEEFKDFYNPQNFTVPCLDLECGTPTYPAEIEEIKAELQNITSLEPLVLDSVLKKFEAAALSSDTDFQWQKYIGAFQEIKVEKTRTGDEQIGQTVQKLKEFLRSRYAEIYSVWDSDLPELFKI